MSRGLPSRANLEHLKAQAKDLLREARRGDAEARARVARVLPDVDLASLKLSHAQLVLAREHGLPGWARLKAHVEALAASAAPPVSASFELQRARRHTVGTHTQALARSLIDHGGLLGPPFAPGELEAQLAHPLPLLPLRGGVLFPGMCSMLMSSDAGVDAALSVLPQGGLVAVFHSFEIDPRASSDASSELAEVGVVARVLEPSRSRPIPEVVEALRPVRGLLVGHNLWQLWVQGICRVRLRYVERAAPLSSARVALYDDGSRDTDAIAELGQELRAAARGRAWFAAPLDMRHPMPEPVECLRDPGQLADYVASRLPLSPDVAQQLLEEANVELRLIQVLHALRRFSSLLDAHSTPGAGSR